jgi:glutamine phosphoribosylpyrophosphate amidotransferase
VDVSGSQFAETIVASTSAAAVYSYREWTREVKPGDVVWVEYHNRKVRFRVVWLSAPAMGQEIRAAVERLENKECPGLR